MNGGSGYPSPDPAAGTAVPATADAALDAALAALDRLRPPFWQRPLWWLTVGALLVFYAGSWSIAQVDPARLLAGLPSIGKWLASAWPPRLDELPVFAERAAETVAMAAIGTTMAVLLALPTAVLASRNITAWPWLYRPTRWLLNGLRGIDGFVFALLFVAAVGLGPFAGVLGVALHTWGSAAKLLADAIENADLAPVAALRNCGAGHFAALAYALGPQMLPLALSIALYLFEFNVRASTVLGVVGAGGIGIELKNSLDLLDFNRLFTILAIIVLLVTAIDFLAGWLRRRLT